jgi:hypothetical protein
MWEGKLERFTTNTVSALIWLVNSYWDRLIIELDIQEFQESQFSTDKRLCRLCHYLKLRELDKDTELYWL